MLHLINEGKGGRSFTPPGKGILSWKQLFKASEDSFTSNVFERLFYLPPSLMWELLCVALYDVSLLQRPMRFVNYEFWPRWKYEGGYKEPDIFMRFEDFDVIIEAKRYDDNQQVQQQWEMEVAAYFNEFGDSRDLYLIAVGGIRTGDDRTTPLTVEGKTVPVYKTRWSRILHEIKRHLRRYQEIDSDFHHPVRSILSDLLICFEIHGFPTGDLFGTMPTVFTIDDAAISTLAYKATNFTPIFRSCDIPPIFKINDAAISALADKPARLTRIFRPEVTNFPANLLNIQISQL